MKYEKISCKNMKRGNLILSSENSFRTTSILLSKKYNEFFSLTFIDFSDTIVVERQNCGFYYDELDDVYSKSLLKREPNEKNI